MWGFYINKKKSDPTADCALGVEQSWNVTTINASLNLSVAAASDKMRGRLSLQYDEGGGGAEAEEGERASLIELWKEPKNVGTWWGPEKAIHLVRCESMQQQQQQQQ